MSSFFKKHLATIILYLILAVGFFLRFYQLDKFPVGFHIDEAIMGVNAYFILQTGRDTNNHQLPLQTEVFGDYNPTGYTYLTILPIKIFGLNEFATRFPGAFLGSLTIFAFFLFVYSIFQEKKISLLSALLMAIAPWHIILSRASEQALAALFFVILGFTFILFSFFCKRSLFLLILGIIILFISFFMYFTPRIFVPFIFATILILQSDLWQKQKDRGYKFVLGGSFILLVILTILLNFIVKGGEERFKQVSIFGFPETKLIMEEQIREDGVVGTAPDATRIFHNKIINYSLTYLSNYIGYFSGDFLFIKGGLPPWLKVSGIGLVYLVELPFFIIGLIMLSIHKDKRYKFLLIWLFLAPIAAAVTVDDIPNIRRSLLMFPVVEIISAYGFLHILFHKKYLIKLSLIVVVGLLLVLNFTYFMHQYFVHEKVHRTWYRSNGVAKMIGEIKKVYDNYDKVIISKSVISYPLVLFYMQYDPKTYLLEGSPKDKEYSGFGKFFFVPQECPGNERNNRFPKVKRAVYVNHGTCKDKLFTYQDIYREDGTKASRIAYESY